MFIQLESGGQMDRYWENQSGVYDPTATEVIKNESKRNKEIHDTINQIKKHFKKKRI